MRLRNKPWAADKLKDYPEIVVANPNMYPGKWHDVFGNDHPIHIEIGTGKGQFIAGMAERYPEINFIGIEKFTSVIVSALDYVINKDLKNVRLLNINAEELNDFFAEGEAERIYLNFSDPWPKNRHEKRRLTHSGYLSKYEHIMKPHGEIHLKTDNQGLFEYSLESFSHYGCALNNVSLNLHNSNMKDNIMTEYEERFSAKGMRIYRCEASFKK